MPFLLKALLAVLGVFVAFEIVHAIVAFVFSSVIFIAVGAAAIGLVWYGYRRFTNALPAYRRRQIRNRRDY